MATSTTGEAEALTEEALKKLKVPELKELCKTKKLPVSGTKPVLIARLLGQPAPAAAPSNKRKKDASTADTSAPSTSAAQPSTDATEKTDSISQASSSLPPSKSKVQKGKSRAKANETAPAQDRQESKDSDQIDSAAPHLSEPAKKKAKITPSATASSSAHGPVSIEPAASLQSFPRIASPPIAATFSTTNPAPAPKQASAASTNVLPRTNTCSSSFSNTPKSIISKASTVPPTSIIAASLAHQVGARRAAPAFSVPKPKATTSGSTTLLGSAVSNVVASIDRKDTSKDLSKTSKHSEVSRPARAPAKLFKALVPTKQSSSKEPAVNLSVDMSLSPGASPSATDSQSLLQAYSWVASLLGMESLSCYSPKPILDHGKRLSIALAYIVTKLYTLIGTAEDLATLETTLKILSPIANIECCTEDVSLVTCSDGTSHRVLNASGEVIGSQSNSSSISDGADSSNFTELAVRPDWKAYLDEREQSSSSYSIFSLIRSPDEESFVQGISKHWLAKIRSINDNHDGSELLAPARAYVLCHVAPNAVSGSCQTLSEQQAEFSGAGGVPAAAARVRKPKVSLFLPICHQVESVSIKGLHPSIAQIQTPNRAHYTLRLTGQTIGEEDEGILPIFQDMIKCDSCGRPL